jgi:hypothetical protein
MPKTRKAAPPEQGRFSRHETIRRHPEPVGERSDPPKDLGCGVNGYQAGAKIPLRGPPGRDDGVVKGGAFLDDYALNTFGS